MYSVIVPVYQAMESLERCVQSWLAQTEPGLELILVDDGSTDGSGKLCDHLAGKDERIRVIHQGNGGVSSARNAGICASQGEFVLFTDSDDYVAADYLEKMAALQREQDSDLVLCGFHHLYDGADILKLPGNKGTFQIEEFAEDFLELYGRSYLNMPWNKLFRREYMGRFDTSLSLGEDLLFNLDYLKKCRRVSVLSEPLCYYIQEEQKATLSSKKRRNRLELARRICEETERFYEEMWGDGAGENSQAHARIFTRYMNEVLDECEKLPGDRTMSHKDKLKVIRSYARDPWVRERGGQAILAYPDYRILWCFLKRDMPGAVYILCLLRRIAVVIVHRIRRRGSI